jgi:sodium-dependent phosphate transporter
MSLLLVAVDRKVIVYRLQTQCIAGASIGVGLANGDWRCINMRLVGWIYFGWVITVPITALISGMLMGLILNAPRWS